MSGKRGPKLLGDDSMNVAARVPGAVVRALHAAAAANYESPAAYMRRALVKQLRDDGLLPQPQAVVTSGGDDE